tara:strand:- start:2227 stop:2859 length:633 start_codon:yes stop_codon:yes gene_type:complete
MQENITGQRLRELRARRDMKAIDVAKALGIQRTRVSNWETGIRNPQREELVKLAALLDVSPAYLIGWINEEIYSTHQPIEQNTLTLNNGENVTLESATSAHAYSEQFLAARDLKARQLMALTVDDDAMHDVVCKGDTVLVDMQRKRSGGRDLFAMFVNGSVWVRWIRPELDNTFTVSAEDNTQYPDQTLTKEQLEALDIIGRIARIERDR